MTFIGLVIALCFVVFMSLGVIIGYFFSFRRKNLISRIESITENVPNIPIQGFDCQGKIFLWNRASVLIYGHTRQQAIGKNIAELVLPESQRQLFKKTLQKICKDCKPPEPQQWTVITNTGEKRTMYSTMFPYIKNGKCVEVFCFDVDISDIKNHAEALDVDRESYKAIFNGVNEAIFVHEPDTGKILDVNEKMCEIFDYTKEEACNLYFKDISYGEKDKIREKAKALIAKAFYEGPQLFDWLGLSKTGRIFPALVSLKKAVVDGRKCVLASVRDISKQRVAEERAYQTEKRYQDLLDNSIDLIFTTNAEGIINSVNSAAKRIFGFEEEEVLGKHFSIFLPEEEHARAQEIFEYVFKNAQMRNDEIKCFTKDKQKLILKIHIWPECRDEKIVGVHGVAADITSQKVVLERMREMVIQIVSMLSQTVSVADRYTEEHCERLQELSIKIGAKLQLDKKQLENLKFAALLHDVGKVGIPINILIKKGELTPEEWKKIKEHPKKGADIVRQLSGFEEVAQIIEQHQERVDGTGYPDGLSKDEIKREAAIISVVDAFDAMTSDRPYRKALSLNEAIEELKRNAGTQFDVDVVNAFIEIIQADLKDNI